MSLLCLKRQSSHEILIHRITNREKKVLKRWWLRKFYSVLETLTKILLEDARKEEIRILRKGFIVIYT